MNSVNEHVIYSRSASPFQMPIKVFDFFSGAGGGTKGFQNAGMEVVFATDNDPDAAKTFEANFPNAVFLQKDIAVLSIDELQSLISASPRAPILFSACAPCQPFTKQNTQRKTDDARKKLLHEFCRFVDAYHPDLIFVENVPGLQKLDDVNGPFITLLESLDKAGYHHIHKIVSAKDYGVPQKRRRLILLASLLGPISFPAKTHGPNTDHLEYSTVREWIEDLPPIGAGECNFSVPNHRAATLSPLNLRRIKTTPEGGSRRDWPTDLHLYCHTGDYRGHSDVYGRMSWDKAASGLTTRCISLSNGRFGHPEQDRAISIREAACLQTFPRDFIFHGNLNSMARQIGNALPVLLAERFGHHFKDHVNTYIREVLHAQI